jgi:hypothetical protein
LIFKSRQISKTLVILINWLLDLAEITNF